MRKIIRWTIGGNNARQLSDQAFDMLETSVKFALLNFDKMYDDVDYYICHNNLDENEVEKIEKISEKTKVEIKDVTGELTGNLSRIDVKNSWWKFTPPRIDKNSYEILMDNDLIIWNLPETLENSIVEDSLVALTDAKGAYYGDYQSEIERLDYGFKLNAGLIGLPKNFIIDPYKVGDKEYKDFFHTEQGFVALNYLKYSGNKRLIGLDEIQQINVKRVNPKTIIEKYNGAHFCGCSYGHYDFWSEAYSKPIKDYYDHKGGL